MPRHSDKACRSFFGAREGGQDRDQDIFTPQPIIDAILQVWPDGIELDPAYNQAAIVPCRYAYTERGESQPWIDRTYVNPPYRDILKWVDRFESGREYLLLGPNRTNRAPFVAMLGRASRVCFLRPLKFVGFSQAYPTPLVMVYFGTRVDAFDSAFAPFGTVGMVVTRANY
jgi:hypothetical protein